MKNEDKIRQAIKWKLQEQRTQSDIPAGEIEATRRFGSFLAAVCQNRGWTTGDLARKLDVELALAEAILNGFLPRSEIDDGFLSDIAEAIDYKTETLKRVLIQKPPT